MKGRQRHRYRVRQAEGEKFGFRVGPKDSERQNDQACEPVKASGTALNRYEKSISAPGQRFDETRRIRIVSKSLAYSPDAKIQTQIEVYESLIAPDLLVNLVPGNDLPALLCEQAEHLEGLRRQFYRIAILPQFAVLQVDFEGTKAQ
jgi:hypothetical protein